MWELVFLLDLALGEGKTGKENEDKGCRMRLGDHENDPLCHDNKTCTKPLAANRDQPSDLGARCHHAPHGIIPLVKLRMWRRHTKGLAQHEAPANHVTVQPCHMTITVVPIPSLNGAQLFTPHC